MNTLCDDCGRSFYVEERVLMALDSSGSQVLCDNCIVDRRMDDEEELE